MTANEKSILRARILKWLTRIFLIIIGMITVVLFATSKWVFYGEED